MPMPPKSRLYEILSGLIRENKITTMEGVAVAACCEFVLDLSVETRTARLGTKVEPVLVALMQLKE